MTSRTRLVLSLFVTLFLLIALLLVAAPDANPITAQFATATPCATQPQIAPTFDTGNEPTGTPKPTSIVDSCTVSTPTPIPQGAAQTGNGAYPQAVPSPVDGCASPYPINGDFTFENFYSRKNALCLCGDARYYGSVLQVANTGDGVAWLATPRNINTGFEA